MRILLLTRGLMGAGKSEWIRRNNLEQYTLSADNIRLLFQSPVLDNEGKFSISGSNDNRVWGLLIKLLEERMIRGEFTIVDATHIKTSQMAQYKKLAKKYRYRVFAVDFTDVPLELALERNRKRPEHKQVPDEVIANAFSRLEIMNPQGWITNAKPDEVLDMIHYKPIDLTHWDKIHHIGDIHGCYDALMGYLGEGLKDNELYIFLGDFVDRGTQNYEVVKFIAEIANRPNVILIQGNHEIHLWKWANGEEVRSKEFNLYTAPELEAKAGDNIIEFKKEVRNMFRKMRQVVYYEYKDKLVLVTHGGLTNLPDDLEFVATDQFIKGVGKYETPVDEIFERNTKELIETHKTSYDGIYQIHGHRNIQRYPVQVTEHTFNLEGQVEFGGHLRAVTLTENGFATHEYLNENINKRFIKLEDDTLSVSNEPLNNADWIKELRENVNIRENRFGNISSFNFTKRVFRNKLWDKQTMKARGLFINVETGEIVSRSYNKFFNINERSDTKIHRLRDRLKFPVNVFLKENGYLGIVGYDSQSGELVISSKSRIDGDFAVRFRELFFEQFDSKQVEVIKNVCKETNVSLVFEVIDPIFDPHIIEYKSPQLVLLDMVSRNVEYSKRDYSIVKIFAGIIGVKVKEHVATLYDWTEFYNFYNAVVVDLEDEIEGYVFEDANGFMTKLKTPYYNFWKHMRTVKDQVAHDISKVEQGWLYTPLHNKVFAFFRDYPDRESLKHKDIITLRKEFFESQKIKCR
ncbi:hypothetical protein QB910_000079 [Dabrowskivirus KKP3916]|uniref:Phosphatase n=1 Tax=Alicyclobacillus phage KKP_3916 TaxID=3040651 RepID=A0AAT9V7R7_9CAUD|nr:hypothetical protein QB910_000079 [Alicyclobacillus phage KKP 3916]